MKNKDLTDPTLSIQEQKRIAIEILRQYHRWEMANPRPRRTPGMGSHRPVQKK